MFTTFMFIHLLGAVAMGFYLLLPFLAGKVSSLDGGALSGFSTGLYSANRIAQFLLIAQLITGGYLMSKGDYSHGWMAVVLVLLIAVGAVSGIVGVNLKRIQQAAAGSPQGNGSISGYAGKVKTLSWVLGVLFLIIVYLMYHPSLSW